jgi:hypothetical protein
MSKLVLTYTFNADEHFLYQIFKVDLAIKKCRKQQLKLSEIENINAHLVQLDVEHLWS